MALKGRPPDGYEKWMETVAELMSYEQMSFSLSCQAAGRAFKTSGEEREVELSDAFRSVLRAVQKERRIRLLDELSKDAMEAELWDVVKELRREKQADKIFGPASLIVKMRGWAIEEQENKPVIGNLTQASIDRVRQELDAQEETLKEAQVQPASDGKLN